MKAGKNANLQQAKRSKYDEFYTQLTDIESTSAEKLKDVLRSALNDLVRSEQESLVKDFALPLKSPQGKDLVSDGVVRVLLMLAAATMFHARLQPHLELRPAEEYPSDDPEDGPWVVPERPGACRDSADPVEAFLRAWNLILRVDYRQIFESAGSALAFLHGSLKWSLVVKRVTKVALSIASQVPQLRHDLLGSIFHAVLPTARHDGSYYTTTTAATLLAGLAIRREDCDWADPDAIARLNICDPSCGSGTLLLASAERISELRRDTNGVSDPEGEQLLGQLLIEDVLWGYDINTTAVHLASTTLGLLAPSVNFDRMNLFGTELGKDEVGVHLGSLELLPSEMAGSVRLLAPAPHKMRQAEACQATEEEARRAANPPPMDLVIMNPPFTASHLRYNHLGKTTKDIVVRREQGLLSNHLHREAAKLHSSGGPFLLLAEHLVNNTGGTLATVLPATAVTSQGNLGFRKFYAATFHIDHIVIPHDPKHVNFSGATSIAEVLVVGRRKGFGDNIPTKVVKLLRNPSTPMEAARIVELLTAPSPPPGPSEDAPFVVETVSSDRVEKGDWRNVIFTSAWLMDELLELEASCELLGNQIVEIGPTGRRIRDAFDNTSPIATGMQAHWYHKSERITAMNSKPDTWIRPHPDRPHLAHLAARYWSSRQRLLLVTRFRLNTMRLLAVRSEQPSIGSLFIPVKCHDTTQEKALCAWFNSTLGVLGIVGAQVLKNPSYIRFGKGDHKTFPVPKFTNREKTLMAEAYESLKDSVLASLPRSSECQARAELDSKVANAVGTRMGFDTERVTRIRNALCEEPAIRHKRVEFRP